MCPYNRCRKLSSEAHTCTKKSGIQSSTQDLRSFLMMTSTGACTPMARNSIIASPNKAPSSISRRLSRGLRLRHRSKACCHPSCPTKSSSLSSSKSFCLRSKTLRLRRHARKPHLSPLTWALPSWSAWSSRGTWPAAWAAAARCPAPPPRGSRRRAWRHCRRAAGARGTRRERSPGSNSPTAPGARAASTRSSGSGAT